MAKSHSGSSPKKKRSSKLYGLIPVAIVLLVIVLGFRSCSSNENDGSGGVIHTARSRGTVAAAAVPTYQVELPSGGSVHIPEKNGGGVYSDAVHVPSGFTLCRDADRGSGSYTAQNRNQSQSDDWKDFALGLTGNEERYQSNGPAQTLRYHFVPESGHC